jgi:hypothetical protein
MKKASCRLQTLASDGLCSVDFCPGCQVFHIRIGYATLHLNPEAFSAMCATVNTALARFQRHSETADEGPLAAVRENGGKNPLH